MNTIDLKNTLLEELDFVDAPGFRSAVSWPNDRPIPHISSAYFIQGNPVVYFSQFEEVDPAALAQLYRSVWSQGKAPLLYVISRQDILVFNSYDGPPPRDNPDEILSKDGAHRHRLLHHLQSLYDIETARQEITGTIRDYRRILLDTGAFWQTDDGQRINREKRADQRLLASMDQLRRHLFTMNLSSEVAYALLGRSIFIRYLEDRGILNETLVAQITNELAHNYLAALDSKEVTYELFDYLHLRFNGDIFPVDELERQVVSEEHLGLIQRFLQREDLETGQLSFWPYDFSYVPIELISGIYDTFLSDETRKQLGTYNTPLALVDFIVEETLPLAKTTPEMTILDPACGSGVFLVRAYQRLIEAWKQRNQGHPSAPQLTELMKQSIFGVDVQLNAVRIAAFSLCLSMLDYLKNGDIIQESFRFPRMETSNLIHTDFFSEEIDHRFSDKKFDRIVGNPPWGNGTLKGLALKWVTDRNLPTGDKQLVQAFLYRAPHFCVQHGEVAMLAPTKSTIIVGSNTHQKFRQKFFSMYHVRAVVNFSALVYELFPDSLSPSIALFYQSEQPTEQNKLIYATPKPSSLSQSLGAIVIDAADIRHLEREELRSHPTLWKVAMWGNPRDAGFIERLQSLPPLEHLEKTGHLREEIQEGFIVGNRKTEALWLQGMPCVDTAKFQPYVVKIQGTVQASHFERPRTPMIYTGPLALIHRSSCQAAFFAGDQVAYRDQITGIAGQPGEEQLLKWIVVYINSTLACYYHFLTSPTWAVERGTIRHGEYKRMPLIIPDKDDPRLQEALTLFEEFMQLYQKRDEPLGGRYDEDIEKAKERIDELVFDIYDVVPIEQQLVKDMVDYEIKFFEWSKRKTRRTNDAKARPVQPPEASMLEEYAQAFIEVATSLLHYQNQTLNASIYQDGEPLSVVEFELVQTVDAQAVRFISNSRELHNLLYKLDRRLWEHQASTLYTRRHVRIYDGPRFYVVRPGERRLWTRSQAYADAGNFVAQILSRSKRAAAGAVH
ncbi:MAG: SAM-dependent DNA methyltransferase [Ktedonobacteraceae bacterium]|nr:SAM-dependent DNA methyltransferase [Ktedonobacteraceae bacterium]